MPNDGRRVRHDEKGVSTVLGAILLVGLVFIVFATMRVTFVPHWEDDREAAQMLTAEDQLTSFKSALDRLIANQTSSSIATTLDLNFPHTTFLGTFGSFGSISFTPGASGPVLSADQFQFLVKNGAGVGGETFQQVSTAPVTNIGDIQSLRLRFTVSETALHNNKDSLQLQVKDAQGVVLGTQVVSLLCSLDCDADDNLFVNIETDDAGGNVLYNQGYAVGPIPGQGSDTATYWVDSLDPQFQFKQLLSGAPTPFNLQLTDDGLQAQYAITYHQLTTQGTVLVGGGSNNGIPLLSNVLGGTLAYDSANQYYPRQKLVVEAGAVILDQPGAGQVFILPPDVRVNSAASLVNIGLGASSLSGVQTQLGGAANVQLQARIGAVSSFTGTTPHLVLNYTTAYPALYNSFFAGRFSANGLLSSGCNGAGNRPTCNYQITQGAGWVRVDVFGFTNSATDDASATPAYDVNLQAQTGSIAFALLP